MIGDITPIFGVKRKTPSDERIKTSEGVRCSLPVKEESKPGKLGSVVYILLITRLSYPANGVVSRKIFLIMVGEVSLNLDRFSGRSERFR
jgi:hypothetical protein